MKILRALLLLLVAAMMTFCGCASAGAKETPAATRTPRPKRTPRPTKTPRPTPTPEYRYHAGERLSGTVLDVSSPGEEMTTFVMQSFWREAIFVAVSDMNVSDDVDGTYQLKPGARVIVRFAQDVPDVPPFNAGADEVKIVDYNGEEEALAAAGLAAAGLSATAVNESPAAEAAIAAASGKSNGASGANGAPPDDAATDGAGSLAAIGSPNASPGVSPSPGVSASPDVSPSPSPASDPYSIVLARLLKDDAELYKGLRIVAVDVSRAEYLTDSTQFKARAEKMCVEAGFEFIFASDLELFAQGVMNDEGAIDDGVYIAFSDSGANGSELKISAARQISSKIYQNNYTLKSSDSNGASEWKLTSPK